jgi:branched-chain amino acid transport system substrate-binding protein
MKSIVFFLIFAFSMLATAQEKIVIGQSVKLSGEATGRENMEGALAYFDRVNSQGGVHGRRIELKTYDDKRKPELTKQNTERLVKEDNALALFGYRSTPTVEATLPLLISSNVPMIAPFSGAQSLHNPPNSYLFHLRASYQDETTKMVDTLGMLLIKTSQSCTGMIRLGRTDWQALRKTWPQKKSSPWPSQATIART